MAFFFFFLLSIILMEYNAIKRFWQHYTARAKATGSVATVAVLEQALPWRSAFSNDGAKSSFPCKPHAVPPLAEG